MSADMRLLTTIPVEWDYETRPAAHGVTVSKQSPNYWDRVRAGSGCETATIEADAVVPSTSLQDQLVGTIQQRLADGVDTCAVIYNFADVGPQCPMLPSLASSLVDALQPEIHDLHTAQDNDRQLQVYREEESLSTLELLHRHKASVEEIDGGTAEPLPKPAPQPAGRGGGGAGFGGGTAAARQEGGVGAFPPRVPDREALRMQRRRNTIATLLHRRSSFAKASLPPGSFVIDGKASMRRRRASAAASAAGGGGGGGGGGAFPGSAAHGFLHGDDEDGDAFDTDQLRRAETEAKLLRRSSMADRLRDQINALRPGRKESFVFSDGTDSQDGTPSPMHTSAPTESGSFFAQTPQGSRRDAPSAAAAAAAAVLTSRNGLDSATPVACFPRLPSNPDEACSPHLYIEGLKGLGRDAARVGVDLWVRTAEVHRKQTLLQVVGRQMEMLQVVINQDITGAAVSGVVYVKLRDSLYNDLELHADTNEVINDRQWHLLSIQVVDLREDNLVISLDGVPLRTRVGSHTCPYAFENWGTEAEPAFAFIGGHGGPHGDVSMKSFPFWGSVADLVIWCGDRITHYFPLRETAGSGGKRGSSSPAALSDAQGDATCVSRGGVAFEPAVFPPSSLLFEGCHYANCGPLGALGEELSGAVTVDLWIRLAPSGEGARKMCVLGVTDPAQKRQQLLVYANTDEWGEACPGALMLAVRDSDGHSMTTAVHASVDDGKWHHLLWAICDSANHSVRVELDERSHELKMGSLETPKRFAPFSAFLAIGAHNNRGTPCDFLQGSVKSVKVWTGKGRGRALKAYWRMDEGPGAQILMDCTGHGHNAVVCRVPPSSVAPASEKAAACLLKRRRASAVGLQRAKDLSFKHARWVASSQPITSDDEITQEAKRQALLAQRTDEEDGRDHHLRICFLEVAAVEEGGAFRERVFDCLHETMISVGPAGVPPECWDDVSPDTIRLALERAVRYRSMHSRSSHLVVSLWVGERRITVVQLLGRTATHRVTLLDDGDTQWTGPVALVGAAAKQRHVLCRGMSALDKFFYRNGTGCLTKNRPAEGDSALSHLLYYFKTRGSAPGGGDAGGRSPCVVVFNPQTFQQLKSAAVLCSAYCLGEKLQAATQIQKLWRSYSSKYLVAARVAENKRRSHQLQTALHLEHENLSDIVFRYFTLWYHYCGSAGEVESG